MPDPVEIFKIAQTVVDASETLLEGAFGTARGAGSLSALRDAAFGLSDAGKSAAVVPDVSAVAQPASGYMFVPGNTKWDAVNSFALDGGENGGWFKTSRASVKAGDMTQAEYDAEWADYQSWVRNGKPKLRYPND